MKTNHDSFENDLQALMRSELPAAWREEILHVEKAPVRVAKTPRWLVAGWGIAWAAILAMYATMPPDPPPSSQLDFSAVNPWQQHAAIEALLAAN